MRRLALFVMLLGAGPAVAQDAGPTAGMGDLARQIEATRRVEDGRREQLLNRGDAGPSETDDLRRRIEGLRQAEHARRQGFSRESSPGGDRPQPIRP